MEKRKLIKMTTCILIIAGLIISSGFTSLVFGEEAAYSVGDVITFGTYEQDNDTANGKEDIEWIVLAVEEGRMLVISNYGLDTQQYHTGIEWMTWEKCSLREWLNDTFLNNAFNAEEQEMIATAEVKAERNDRWKNVSAGKDTEDKIFLLSISEAEKYFAADEDRQCKPTAYAAVNGARTFQKVEGREDLDYCEGNCWWWLRTPGDQETYASDVLAIGAVDKSGFPIDSTDMCVRPAMWINLE